MPIDLAFVFFCELADCLRYVWKVRGICVVNEYPLALAPVKVQIGSCAKVAVIPVDEYDIEVRHILRHVAE
jgi:hypothetical protein